jgi:hypothetical protein
MKKIIFTLVIMMALVFIGLQSAFAQQNYNITVQWNDGNCQCGPSVDKFVKLLVINTNTNDTIINTPWKHASGFSHQFTGTAEIYYDCDCYSVNAAVYYYDESVCCQGVESDSWDGDKVIGPSTIPVNMQ